MRVSRVYVDTPLATDQRYEFTPQQSHYLKHVLRVKSGEPIILFNGTNKEYLAVITLEGKNISAQIDKVQNTHTESPLNSLLIQAVSRSERMDYSLQKATELGVTEILPVFTERSVVRLSSDRLIKKHQHWQGVVQSAAEQSGRSKLPVLHSALEFNQFLANFACEQYQGLVLNPNAKYNLMTIPLNSAAIALFIGPEGGLCDTEVSRLEAEGFTSVGLGPRILRTETATVTGLSLLQARSGDLGQ